MTLGFAEPGHHGRRIEAGDYSDASCPLRRMCMDL
jgi:hypothetical protein